MKLIQGLFEPTPPRYSFIQRMLRMVPFIRRYLDRRERRIVQTWRLGAMNKCDFIVMVDDAKYGFDGDNLHPMNPQARGEKPDYRTYAKAYRDSIINHSKE